MSPEPDLLALPLSPAQERLWFLDQLHPDSPAYLVVDAVRLRGPLDVPALAGALTDVVRRHEVLRTRFASVAGAPVQIVQPPAPFALDVVDLTSTPAGEREARLTEELARFAARPIALDGGLLLRAALHRLAADEHVLTLAVHHVAYDAWSDQVLRAELAALYRARRDGTVPDLPEPELQYADVALWQRERLGGPAEAADLAYWRDVLADAPQALELPTDRLRPAAPRFRGASHAFALGADLTAALRDLAAEQGVTPFMVLLGAFQALLARWSGQATVLVGTPVANRDRTELEQLIGFFTNTLVLRADLPVDLTGRALLLQVRDRALAAYEHGEVPFERVVEDLAPPRDPSRNPVFQVMFALNNATAAPLALAGLETTEVTVPRDVALFDLLLYVEERADGLHALLQYDSELFDHATVVRLAGRYRTLLGGLLAEPDRPVGALDLLPPEERAELLAWSSTGPGLSPEAPTIPVLVEAQARRTPDAVAARFRGADLTYRELWERVDDLARRLRRLHVGPDVCVAVCLERSFDLLVAVLGVLRAGGAYVPVDPDHPADRQAWVLADATPAAVVGTRTLLDRLPAHDLPSVCLDEPAPPRLGVEPLPPQPGQGDLAYVMYTSGSTGRPKGVMVEHGSVTNRVLWMQDTYGLTADDRLLQKTPFGFDVSVWELVWPLVVGATVVLAEPGGHTDPAHVAAVLEQEAVTTVHFVPSMLEPFLDEPELVRRCATLRRVFCSGEALSPALRARFLDRVGDPLGVGLHNEYGPTETGEVTVAEATRAAAPHSIGRPLAGATCHVVDRWLRPVGVGTPGELLVGGVAVARGYHARPGLTADRYLPNPFGPGRLYRTGDVCAWRADGTLDYLGRADHQLKVSGVRVEPGEVEAVLLGQPGVRQAAVVGRPDATGALRLVAYVVTDAATGGLDAPDGAEVLAGVRRHAARQLPAALVPAAIVPLAALPVTANGKLDRAALPAPSLPSPSPAGGAAPRTDVERRLVELWAEVLGCSTVGVHDGFFDLGGHSLLANRVVVRACRALGVDLPLRAIFEHPTVAGLAEVVAGLTAASGPRVPRRPEPDEPQPLSDAQARIWFLDRLVPGSAAYSIVDAHRLSGPVDAVALGQALTVLVERHEALRTSVTTWHGAPRQQPGPPYVVRLDPVDLPAAEVDRALAAEAARPVDVASGELLRARLWRLGPQEWVLALVVHHLALDEWSLGVLTAELGVLYRALRSGSALPAPLPGPAYGDLVAWQRAQLESGALDTQLQHWLTELADVPEVLDLPTDRPRPAAPTFRGARLRLDLDPDVGRDVRRVAREAGATVFMTFLASFQAWLYRLSGQPTVVVGTPVVNRGTAEAEGVVGLFTNTLAVRADVDARRGFGALLAQVRRRAVAAYAHQTVPYERVVEALAPARAAGHNPVFQAMFALQEADADRFALDDVRATPVVAGNGTAKLDLTLDVVDAGAAGFALELEYSTDLFDVATAQRLAESYRRLLTALVREPARPVEQLALLGADERETERAWSDGGARAADPGDLVHDLVATWVHATPDALAVTWDGGRLTYAELDASADRVAAALRRAGAGAEDVVSVCLPRGPELVAAELGVLRAGAAYLPIDPVNPPDRIAFTCADAGVRVVLTDTATAGRVPGGLHAVRVDALPERPEGPGTPVATVDPAQLAYVISTSGSTGRPKGVMVEHASLANVARWRARRCDLGPGDRTAMIASPGFDASVTDVWPALTSGACICVPDQETRLSPARLQRWLLENEVTATEVPTPLGELLLDLDWPERTSLRLLVTGGDRLHGRPRPGLPFVVLNEYGPTENTATSTAGVVLPVGEADGLPSIGTAIAGTTARVLDAALQPRPVGARGQLLLGGAGVSRGYLGRPALTAERFLPDPYAAVPGARMYVSGDTVRRRRDGELDFLGRSDRQVKIRGFRIELGEVTAALRRQPGVADAWVVARASGGAAGIRLVAYVVPAEPSAAPSVDALRAGLARELAPHMVPSATVVLPALPLNRSGKVDETRLPGPDLQPAGGAALVRPSSVLEARLVEIWREVLQCDQVGVADSFFDLGGHSLLVAQVHGRLVELLDVPVAMVALFEHPTIRALAAHLTTEPAPAGTAAVDRVHTDAPGARTRAARARQARRVRLAPLIPTTTAGGTSHVR